MYKKIVFVVLFALGLQLSSQEKSIAVKASELGKFKILLAAATEAGLAKALDTAGPFTLLAPSDEAFGKLAAGTVESLLKVENRKKLISILKFHLIEGRYNALELAAKKELTSLNGKVLNIDIKNGSLMVESVKFIGTDVKASNGVIHVIDSVLIPFEPSPQDEIRKVIELAIDKGVDEYNSGNRRACAAIYQLCIEALLKFSSDDLPASSIAELKKAVVVNSKKTDAALAWERRRVLDRLYLKLDKKTSKISTPKSPAKVQSAESKFKVRLEAALPKGFPAPGPLNKFVYKKYPIYRAAKIDNTSQQNISFMRLFGHIKKNGISMTAPVEMDLNEKAQRTSMAFLYGNRQMGSAGNDLGVVVTDLPAREYISIGLNGRETQQRLQEAITRLKDFVSSEKSVKLDGKARLLGYNSPMVPAAKRFWEVQIPIIRL